MYNSNNSKMKVFLETKTGELKQFELTETMTQTDVMSHFKNEGFNTESLDLEIHPNCGIWLNVDNGQVMGMFNF